MTTTASMAAETAPTETTEEYGAQQPGAAPPDASGPQNYPGQRMQVTAGGFKFGTFEELFEALTWLQLDIHRKPVALFNVNGYYDHLLAFLRHTSEQGFVREGHLGMLLVDDDPAALLEKMAAFRYETISKV